MSSQPPRFRSGGYQINIPSYGKDDTIFPMREDDQSPDQYYTHAKHDSNYPQEVRLQQKIAQSLLTPRKSNKHHQAFEDDAILFGMDEVPVTAINPPWEQSVADDTAAASNNHYRGDSTTQFPTMSPFPRSDERMKNAPQVAVATTQHPNNDHSSNNNGPSSTKSVTFNTHDEFHSWDEQLDQLLHVDEEFFNVAHFLLEVVNVGSVNNFDDENAAYFQDEEENDGYEEALTPVNESGDCGILAKIFTFQCGTPQGIYRNTDGQDGQHQMSSSSNYDRNNGVGGQKKKYRLTKKLVRDFQQALKFRLENIESNESLTVGGVMESEIVTRTREIADKVEAYGLPGMPLPHERITQVDQNYQDRYEGEDIGNGSAAAYGDCYEDYDREEEEEYNTGNVEESKPERKQPRHFPILPTDDDEDGKKRDDMDEDEQRFYNTFGSIAAIKEGPQNQRHSAQSLFRSLRQIFKALVGPTTSTPSKEQCQLRLRQIQREISNVERMMESSRSNEVIAACVNRINKLKDEKRMYQIFKEIYKIQTMMRATESESVKKACSERLYQLTSELKSIDLSQYDEEVEETDANPVVYVEPDARDVTNVAEATGGDDLGWYERAQRYVHANETQSPVMPNHNPALANGHYRPHVQQYHQPYPYSNQHYPPQPGYIPIDENYYDRRYPEKQQFATPSSPRRVLSPRNGRPYTPGSSPAQHKHYRFHS